MTDVAANIYRPTTVSPPGATIADLLEERGMKRTDLAARAGRPVQKISDLIKGKISITPETAIQLERVLGPSAEFWLSREARYREWLARAEDVRHLTAEQAWLRELPVAEMVRLGWITGSRRASEKVDECLRFFGVASVAAWRERYEKRVVAFRASTKIAGTPGSIAAWLRRGEILAAERQVAEFDRATFRQALPTLRSLTRESSPQVFAPELERLCAACGVVVLFVPAPKGCPASGATTWLEPGKALLLLSLRHRTNDHLWFTFFHEVGHILLHGKKFESIEIDGKPKTSKEENEADRFAADLLIPPAAAARIRQLRLETGSVEVFAEELGIAPGIVVGRMQKDRLLPWSHGNTLKVSYRWEDGGR